MSVWIREILGWLLLGSGLAVFFLAYGELKDRRFFNTLPLCFVGYVIFRGGLHLIKVASAARAMRLP